MRERIWVSDFAEQKVLLGAVQIITFRVVGAVQINTFPSPCDQAIASNRQGAKLFALLRRKGLTLDSLGSRSKVS